MKRLTPFAHCALAQQEQLLVNSSKTLMALGIALIAVQALDILIHVETNQAEAIRITANLLLALWAGLALSGREQASFRLTSALALGGYLTLNGLFLVSKGLTNPAQNDAPRTALFILVALSTLLASALIVQANAT